MKFINMFFSTPSECRAARQWLDAGNPVEAVKVLLGSSQPDHSEVAALRRKCQERLLDEAEAVKAERAVALEWIQWAERCGALPVKGQVLKERLAAFDPAVDYYAGTLGGDCFQPMPAVQEKTPAGTGRHALTSPDQAWVIAGQAVVLSDDEVWIGRAEKAATTGVQLPLQAMIRRCHAVIRRSGGEYTVWRDGSHQDLVAVERSRDGADRRTSVGQECSACELKDGDRIVLGGPPECTMRFDRPVEANASAVLKLDRPGRIGRTAGTIDRVVLMERELVVGGGGAVHVGIANFAARRLVFRWTPVGLTADAGDDVLCSAEPGADVAVPLCVPSTLAVGDNCGKAWTEIRIDRFER